MCAQAKIHFSSVNNSLTAPEPPRRGGSLHLCPLVAFEEVTRSEGRLVVRQCSAVSAHPLPLVAAQTTPQRLPLADWDSDGWVGLLYDAYS